MVPMHELSETTQDRLFGMPARDVSLLMEHAAELSRLFSQSLDVSVNQALDWIMDPSSMIDAVTEGANVGA